MTAQQAQSMDLRQGAAGGKKAIAELGNDSFARYLQVNKNALASTLPKHITPERMMRLTLNAVRNTPALTKCTADSVFASVLVCAQLGVEPNTPFGHAYLVPYGNQCQFILGYRGMIQLAMQSDEVASLDAQVVFENDDFEYEKGLEERLSFRKATGDRGKFIGAYAVVKFKTGGHYFDFFSAEDINERRDRSASFKAKKKDSPWFTDTNAMRRKTTIRMIQAFLPMDPEKMSMVAALETLNDMGKSQNLGILDGQLVYGDDPESEVASIDQSAGAAEVEAKLKGGDK